VEKPALHQLKQYRMPVCWRPSWILQLSVTPLSSLIVQCSYWCQCISTITSILSAFSRFTWVGQLFLAVFLRQLFHYRTIGDRQTDTQRGIWCLSSHTTNSTFKETLNHWETHRPLALFILKPPSDCRAKGGASVTPLIRHHFQPVTAAAKIVLNFHCISYFCTWFPLRV